MTFLGPCEGPNAIALTVYPSDIADELQIEYDRAVRLIEGLVTDGQVARV
jgi:hypothetical protein